MLVQNHGVSHVGEFFKKYRSSHGFTQSKLAEMLDVDQTHICFVEVDRIKSPDTLIKKLYPLLNYDEQEKLVDAVRLDHFDKLNKFLAELQKR
jgi:predicted transcriptional regulator